MSILKYPDIFKGNMMRSKVRQYPKFSARKGVYIILSPKQQKTIAALLTCESNEQAAKQAGVTPRTISRYLSDPEFKAEYQKALSGLVEAATRSAQRNLEPAVSTLRELMEDKSQNGQIRVSAARSLLEYSLKLSERVDILERLDILETTVGEKHG